MNIHQGLTARSFTAVKAVTFAAAFAAATQAQTTLLTTIGSPVQEFGRAVAMVGDTNGDGFSDYVIGANAAAGGGTKRGLVELRSGRDGSLIRVHQGSTDNDRFGYSVAAAGDVNDDGFADWIGGTLGGNYARVFSGLDGALLWDLPGPFANDFYGYSVAAAGDVDQDGFDDVVVGTNVFLAFKPGYAQVVSGQNGSLLLNLQGEAVLDMFGTSVASAGDVNGDEIPDLIVGARSDDSSAADAGVARVFSGANGDMLHEFFGDQPDDSFGWSVDGAGDVNGDGYDDLVVGAPACGPLCFFQAGYARVFSGLDGTVLRTHRGKRVVDQTGYVVAGAGDFDGDGFSDVMVASRGRDNRQFDDAGAVEIFSGSTGERIFKTDGASDDEELGFAADAGRDANGDGRPDLIAAGLAGSVVVRSVRLGRDVAEISLSGGGTQTLSLVAGPNFAGASVALLGAEQTAPGLYLDGHVLPLALNASPSLLVSALQLSLRSGQNFMAPLVATAGAQGVQPAGKAGFLDAFGEAQMKLEVPAQSAPSLAGLTLHHAYFVMDADQVVLTSGAVSVTMVP